MDIERESNNRLNDDDRAEIEEEEEEEEKARRLRATPLNGVRIQNNSMKAKERTTNGLQMIINIRQTEMLFNKKSSTYYV
jgi:CO dehydrogenase/acetyl-CoA synthase beta subunit